MGREDPPRLYQYLYCQPNSLRTRPHDASVSSRGRWTATVTATVSGIPIKRHTLQLSAGISQSSDRLSNVIQSGSIPPEPSGILPLHWAITSLRSHGAWSLVSQTRPRQSTYPLRSVSPDWQDATVMMPMVRKNSAIVGGGSPDDSLKVAGTDPRDCIG